MRETVLDRRTGQSVPVRDLDDGNAGFVQRLGDRAHLGARELVAHRMRAIAQAAIGDAWSFAMPCCAHALTSFPLSKRCAMTSPTRLAAEVMISRLPAYFGR